MLDLEFIEPSEVDRVAAIFHRDGLVVVTDALTDEEFAFLKDESAPKSRFYFYVKRVKRLV